MQTFVRLEESNISDDEQDVPGVISLVGTDVFLESRDRFASTAAYEVRRVYSPKSIQLARSSSSTDRGRWSQSSEVGNGFFELVFGVFVAVCYRYTKYSTMASL